VHNDYHDITSRIKEEPKWYDQNGAPRYDAFNPMDVPNIYATEVVLVKIKCQDCGKEFMVGMGFCEMDKLYNLRASSYEEDIRQYLKDDEQHYWFPVHYGDPPSHGCVGDTMNCIDIKIVEFWKKEKYIDWVRKPEYEVANKEEADHGKDDKGGAHPAP
jgi:hypothetical protein